MLNLLTATIRMTTPLLLTSLGGVWTQQTGILNIGQEGAMLLASFFSVLGNHYFSSWTAGIACGMASSILFNLLFALLCVNLRANIWVVGMTMNILANSITLLVMKGLFQVKGGFRSPNMLPIPDFGGFSLVIWMTAILLMILWYMDSRTVFGLRLKAAGENEDALASAGVSVIGIRYTALIINGALVGLAGAFLSNSYLIGFTKGMSSGRGWMAVAAVIFGGGSFAWTVFAAILFGFTQSVGIEMQAFGVDSHMTLMLPYLFVIISLVVKGFRSAPPRNEG